jgi:hypothetical protein
VVEWKEREPFGIEDGDLVVVFVELAEPKLMEPERVMLMEPEVVMVVGLMEPEVELHSDRCGMMVDCSVEGLVKQFGMIVVEEELVNYFGLMMMVVEEVLLK